MKTYLPEKCLDGILNMPKTAVNHEEHTVLATSLYPLSRYASRIPKGPRWPLMSHGNAKARFLLEPES